MSCNPVRLPLWQRIWLLRGRPRRFFIGLVMRAYVRRNHARRIGDCRRCGACCQMGVRCPALIDDGPLASCAKYAGRRPMNCRNFPISERDLLERDQIAPHLPCGYSFNGRVPH